MGIVHHVIRNLAEAGGLRRGHGLRLQVWYVREAFFPTALFFVQDILVLLLIAIVCRERERERERKGSLGMNTSFGTSKAESRASCFMRQMTDCAQLQTRDWLRLHVMYLPLLCGRVSRDANGGQKEDKSPAQRKSSRFLWATGKAYFGECDQYGRSLTISKLSIFPCLDSISSPESELPKSCFSSL